MSALFFTIALYFLSENKRKKSITKMLVYYTDLLLKLALPPSRCKALKKLTKSLRCP